MDSQNTSTGPRPLVIIVAMESELTHLRQLIPGWWSMYSEGPWHTSVATHHELPIVAIRCGIGMVAAAAATEFAIQRHQPRWIMNVGCTGAHTREILPGDVVIGTRLIPQGRLRVSPAEGVVPLATSFTMHGEPEGVAHLETDPTLRALAVEAAGQLVLDAWPREHRLPLHPEDGAVRVHVGPVASADMWLQDPAWLDAVHVRTGSLCEDMEAAAIAQVAALHGVPFLTIKDISNNEFHAATSFEGTESALPLAELGRRAAALTVATIDRLIDAEAAPAT